MPAAGMNGSPGVESASDELIPIEVSVHDRDHSERGVVQASFRIGQASRYLSPPDW